MVSVWGWAEKQPSFIARCRKSHRCWKHSAVPQQFSGFLPHGQQCFKGCTQAVTSSITAVPRRVSCCSQLRAGRSPHRLLPSSPAPQWQKLLLLLSSKSFAQPMAVALYFDPRDGPAPCGASKAQGSAPCSHCFLSFVSRPADCVLQQVGIRRPRRVLSGAGKGR